VVNGPVSSDDADVGGGDGGRFPVSFLRWAFRRTALV